MCIRDREKTRAILAKGDFSGGTAVASADGVSVYSSRFKGSTPADVVRAAVSSLQPRDYVAFLSYLPADPAIASAIAGIRTSIRSRAPVSYTHLRAHETPE